jgi:hypothetical protein
MVLLGSMAGSIGGVGRSSAAIEAVASVRVGVSASATANIGATVRAKAKIGAGKSAAVKANAQIYPGHAHESWFGKLQQILMAKQAPSCCQHHKWICHHRRCPARRNRAQAPSAFVEINSILTPVVAIRDQLEPLASQWMMWMDDFKSIVSTVAMRCS